MTHRQLFELFISEHLGLLRNELNTNIWKDHVCIYLIFIILVIVTIISVSQPTAGSITHTSLSNCQESNQVVGNFNYPNYKSIRKRVVPAKSLLQRYKCVAILWMSLRVRRRGGKELVPVWASVPSLTQCSEVSEHWVIFTMVSLQSSYICQSWLLFAPQSQNQSLQKYVLKNTGLIKQG